MTAPLNHYFFLAVLSVFIISGCVSVRMTPKYAWVRAEVTYKAPGASFASLASPHLDRSWKHKEYGNTISFLSECNPNIDPSIENIYRGLVAEFEKIVSEEKKSISYNDRGAIQSTVVGHVDGVPSKVMFMIFKKNGCNYVITFAGLVDQFNKNEQDYQIFLEGFRAP